jgi:hypothetical protein
MAILTLSLHHENEVSYRQATLLIGLLPEFYQIPYTCRSTSISLLEKALSHFPDCVSSMEEEGTHFWMLP